MSDSITENLTQLSIDKTNIQNALVTKGITNANEHGFNDFAGDINNIQNSYSLLDEGKVVSNGALVSQTAYPTTITENGTYDTTTNNSVTIDVSSDDIELTQFLLDSTIANASGGADKYSGSSLFTQLSGNGFWKMRAIKSSTSNYIEPKIKWFKNKIITASFKAAYKSDWSTYTTVYLCVYDENDNNLYQSLIGSRTASSSSTYRREFTIDMTTYTNLISEYPDYFLRLRIYTEALYSGYSSSTTSIYNSNGTVAFS